MIILLAILILLSCIILGFVILVQNPKGGGLSGTFGNMSTAVMGVKQSTDVMEKGTWTMISVIGGLCIISVLFFQKPQADNGNAPQKQTTSQTKKK